MDAFECQPSLSNFATDLKLGRMQYRIAVIPCIVLLAIVNAASVCLGQQGETPPYDPAPVMDKMSTYTNQELGFTVFYPKEFIRSTAADLQAVMERGHRMAYGSDPESDPEHLKAVGCIHSLFYAAADPVGENGTPQSLEDGTSGSILLEDFDTKCMPKKLKGDKALSTLVGSALSLPKSTQLVHQMWFVAGGDRRIHSGMSATMVQLRGPSANKDKKSSFTSVPLFEVVAGVEQKGHRLLIVYLSGSAAAEKHEALPHMSIAFEGERPILLFPFLLGNINLIK